VIRARVYTVGHSTHSLEEFINLIRDVDGEVVVDVRSSPYSRRSPDFGRHALDHGLREYGIGYRFLGETLGGRPPDPALYQDGQVQYDRLANDARFIASSNVVAEGARRRRLVLLCAEADPLQCHRGLVVAPALEDRGVDVVHILPDGHLESQSESMDRLLSMLGAANLRLFDGEVDLVKEARALQARRVAFVDETLRRGQVAL
jgi:uncharacterized protein (DUF488 family)